MIFNIIIFRWVICTVCISSIRILTSCSSIHDEHTAVQNIRVVAVVEVYIFTIFTDIMITIFLKPKEFMYWLRTEIHACQSYRASIALPRTWKSNNGKMKFHTLFTIIFMRCYDCQYVEQYSFMDLATTCVFINFKGL